jgi:hypothetical protein
VSDEEERSARRRVRPGGYGLTHFFARQFAVCLYVRLCYGMHNSSFHAAQLLRAWRPVAGPYLGLQCKLQIVCIAALCPVCSCQRRLFRRQLI